MKKFRELTKRKDLPGVVLLTIIVLFPNIFLAVVGNDLSESLFAKIAFLSISFAIFFMPSLFLKAKVFFLIQGIFVLLAPIEIAHIYLNKIGITIGFMMAVFDTNMGESTEILYSMLPMLFVIFVVWFIYFFVAIKKINNSYLIPKPKHRLYISAGFLLIFCCMFMFYYQTAKKIVPKNQQFLVMDTAWTSFYLKFNKIYPCSFIWKTKEVIVLKEKIKQSQEDLKAFLFHAEKQKNIDEREIYVFVIGETARYSNFSINDYHRETSPLLEKIDNLVSFSNFYAEANLTSISLPMMLTRTTPQDAERYLTEKSFVDAFKEAGFKTYWIANQNSENGFVRRISKDADQEYFAIKDFDSADNFDENLWVYLDEILNKNDKKALIVIHTLGSHFRYNYRYPENFEEFKPNFKGAFNYNLISPENKELFINTYDNSILYTDYFLANTIEKIKKENAVSLFIYTSDHGENLFDTKENIVLHGGAKPTIFDIHVPLFIWSSPEYRNVYGQKWENIERNKDKKLSSDILFYSILDIADITFAEQKPERSITSEFLQEDSVRYMLTPDRKIQVFK